MNTVKTTIIFLFLVGTVYGQKTTNDKMIAAKTNAKDYIHYLVQADSFSKIGILDSTKFYIEKAISFHQHYIISYSNLEFKITRDRLYSRSIQLYDYIIKQDSSSSNFCSRGILKSDVGLFKEALIDFTMAIQIDEVDPINFYNRALTYSRLNQLDNAINDFNICLDLKKDFGLAYMNKGYVMLKKEEFKSAIVVFKKSLEYLINPMSISYCHNNIGFCYFKLNQLPKAVEYIDQSIQLNPANPYAFRNMALVNIKRRKFQKACNNINQSIELGFTNKYGNEMVELKTEHCNK